MNSEKSKTKNKTQGEIKKTLFDHVKHIRQVQDVNYYVELSDADKKTFNHFMIIRALSMDENIVEDMAALYPIHDKIPSEQFYLLLINLIPKSNKFYPWVKSKTLKHDSRLLKIVADRFKVSTKQALEYINILIESENGQLEIVNICQAIGLEEKDINDLFKPPQYNN